MTTPIYRNTLVEVETAALGGHGSEGRDGEHASSASEFGLEKASARQALAGWEEEPDTSSQGASRDAQSTTPHTAHTGRGVVTTATTGGGVVTDKAAAPGVELERGGGEADTLSPVEVGSERRRRRRL